MDAAAGLRKGHKTDPACRGSEHQSISEASRDDETSDPSPTRDGLFFEYKARRYSNSSAAVPGTKRVTGAHERHHKYSVKYI